MFFIKNAFQEGKTLCVHAHSLWSATRECGDCAQDSIDLGRGFAKCACTQENVSSLYSTEHKKSLP